MSHNKDYNRLIHSKSWDELRRRKLADVGGICEECAKQGLTTVAQCVHHLQPVETAHTPEKMAELCFRYSNLQALCYECHSAIHAAERSHSKEAHKKRAQDHMERWKARHGSPGID